MRFEWDDVRYRSITNATGEKVRLFVASDLGTITHGGARAQRSECNLISDDLDNREWISGINTEEEATLSSGSNPTATIPILSLTTLLGAAMEEETQ